MVRPADIGLSSGHRTPSLETAPSSSAPTATNSSSPRRIGAAVRACNGLTVFVFAGQGAQATGMGARN
ncbi:hypothetical protein LT493_00410 [Streptomyces tricolor]|nr:hypothetical protein [Streptomyces tricolor]